MRKNETLDNAFVRLLREELGIESGITRADVRFIGVFEHFYEDNVFDASASTHYIVLGYEIQLDNNQLQQLPKAQHGHYDWWNTHKLLIDVSVHGYSKNYFI